MKKIILIASVLVSATVAKADDCKNACKENHAACVDLIGQQMDLMEDQLRAVGGWNSQTRSDLRRQERESKNACKLQRDLCKQSCDALGGFGDVFGGNGGFSF